MLIAILTVALIQITLLEPTTRTVTPTPTSTSTPIDRTYLNQEDPVENDNELYLFPRAFPGLTLDLSVRSAGIRSLQSMLSWNEPDAPGGGLAPMSPGSPEGRGSRGQAWSSAGPTNINGRVTSIAIHPNQPNIVYAASIGGIWRSMDGGRHWERVSDDFTSQIAASVAVAPDGSEVIAGLGDPNYLRGGAGIWRSFSGNPGTWKNVSPPELNGAVICKLVYDPADTHNIYAATNRGVFLGIHQQASIAWSRLGQFDGNTNDIAVDFEKNNNIVYAGTIVGSAQYSPGIWKFETEAWQKSDSGIPADRIGRISLTIAASDPKILFAKVASTDGDLLGIYKTTTGGKPSDAGVDGWTKLEGARVVNDSVSGSFRYSWYNSVIQVSPADRNIVFAGGLHLYQSKDSGVTWCRVSAGDNPSCDNRDGPPPPDRVSLHADQHAIAFGIPNKRVLWVANDGGIDVSSDTSGVTWNWQNVSHGMVITEFYQVTMQQSQTSIVAGGSQDNGSEITFGNRVWYNPGGCDGNDVGIDSADGDVLFMNCNNRRLYEISNPVPGTDGFNREIQWDWPDKVSFAPPLIADPVTPHAAISAGINSASNPPSQVLLATDDDVHWHIINPALALAPSFIASAPSGKLQVLYVGLSTHPNDQNPRSTIISTFNGGTGWNAQGVGLPLDLRANAAAVDYTNPSRAFAAFGGRAGGGVYLTVDGGGHWTALPGTAPALLPNVPVTGVAVDPFDPNRVYASTEIGVFSGIVSSAAPYRAAWIPFNEGLPDQLDVNSIMCNRALGILAIGTAGHGVYLRDVNPSHGGGGVELVVRDNVFDRGLVPSVAGLPDPEHPIADPNHPGFFKPNDSDAGSTNWFNSPDIRIDVPSVDPPQNSIAAADSVEMESCPTEVSVCPAGSMIDSTPQRGLPANVYVQVNNLGLAPATNVRVIALYSDKSIVPPDLPRTFWSTTFPKNPLSCGQLDRDSDWHFVDALNPCHVVSHVSPEYPEAVQFHWAVPSNIGGHTTILVIVDSPEDQIPNEFRSGNVRHIYKLVPNVRQIAERSMVIIDSSQAPGVYADLFSVLNAEASSSQVSLSVQGTSNSSGRFSVLLGSGAKPRLSGLSARRMLSPLSTEETMSPDAAALGSSFQHLADYEQQLDTSKTRGAGLNLGRNYKVVSTSGAINFTVPAFQQSPVLFQLDTTGAGLSGVVQFNVIVRENGQVVGGTTYVIRPAVTTPMW